MSHNNLRVKNGIFLKLFSRLMQKGSSVMHSPYDITQYIHNMVGRSIASISDLGGIFTLALRTMVNMAPRVGCTGNQPPYHTIYIT